ncbi:PREDICTED: uncharacterized protein LOC109580278 [Amphimedon queenslandica]|uniref:Death domain-containing protein n=1 Tax=Amphimedon queenslandica TaxID=400682 RepID=A0AAN0IWD1_AMPQE|nr:PREDICTED: uncharacterized protein LOC109580278 [Amphimedon queenslandica]|eukprot:XP_019848857.1 PREDICTED: uncharacterized protein LOC109580278 [Amphimedon queenslandica]
MESNTDHTGSKNHELVLKLFNASFSYREKKIIKSELFGESYPDDDLTSESCLRIIATLRPFARTKLKALKLIPHLSNHFRISEQDQVELVDKPEIRQAMHLLDCINIKSSFPISALYIALLDSSSEEDGPPTHHQLACDLARIGKSEFAQFSLKLYDESLTDSASPAVLEQSIEAFKDILITVDQAKSIAERLNMEAVPSLNLTEVLRSWRAKKGQWSTIEDVVEALVLTQGIGRYLILLELPSYPQLKEFFLGLKRQWISIAIYIGIDEADLQKYISCSENHSEQLDVFLNNWTLPDCGQKTVVILHKLRSIAGVMVGAAAKAGPPDKLQRGISLEASGGPYSMPAQTVSSSITVPPLLQQQSSSMPLSSLPVTITGSVEIATVTSSLEPGLVTTRETMSLPPETLSSKNIQSSSRSFLKTNRKHRFNVLKPGTESVSTYNGLKEHQPMTVDEVPSDKSRDYSDPITCSSDLSSYKQRPATATISERVTESEWPQPIQQSHKTLVSLPYAQTAKSQIYFTAPVSVTNTTWSASHPSSTSSPSQSYITSRSPDESLGEEDEESTTKYRPPNFNGTPPPPPPPPFGEKQLADISDSASPHDTNISVEAPVSISDEEATPQSHLPTTGGGDKGAAKNLRDDPSSESSGSSTPDDVEVSVKTKQQSDAEIILVPNPSDIICSLRQGGVAEFRAFLEGLENPVEEINRMVPKDLAEDGSVVLHIAVRLRMRKHVELLLDFGADVDQIDPTNKGMTALHIASELGDKDIMKLLLKKNATVDIRDNNQSTPLLLVDIDSPECVSLLLDAGADIGAANKQNYTPLVIAVVAGCDNIVRMLLERNSSPHIVNHIRKCSGPAGEEYCVTPLADAAARGYIHILKMLIEKGANLNSTGVIGKPPDKSEGHISPLLLPCTSNLVDVVQYITRHRLFICDVDYIADPLTEALSKGHIRCAQLIWERYGGLRKLFEESRDFPALNKCLQKYLSSQADATSTSTSPAVLNVADATSTSTSPAVLNVADATSTSPAVLNVADATSTSPAVLNVADATSTSTSPAVLNVADATSTSPAVLNVAGTTSTSPAVLNVADDTSTSTSPAVLNVADATSTSTSPAVLNVADDTSTSPTVLNVADATSTSPAVLNVADDTSTSPAVLNVADDTSTSPAVLNVADDTSTSTSPAVLNVTTGDTATASESVAYNDLSALAEGDESESLSAPVTVSMMNDFSDIEPTQPGGQNNEEMFVNNLSDIEMPPPPVTKVEESLSTLSTTNQLSVPPVVSSGPIPPVVSSGPVPPSIPLLSTPSLPKPAASFPDLSFPTSTHTQPIMTSSLPPPLSTQPILLPSTSAHISGTPVQSLPPSTESRISPPNMLSSVDDDQPPPSGNEEYIVNDLGGNFTPSLIPARPASPELFLPRPTSLGAIPGASASGGGPRTLSPSAPTSPPHKISYETNESGTDTDNPFEPRPKTPPPPSIPPVSSQALASGSSELGGLDAFGNLRHFQTSAVEVLHDFAQYLILACLQRHSQEDIIKKAEEIGETTLVHFFSRYFFDSAATTRGGEFFSEFIKGFPSPLNFLLAARFCRQSEFEGVLREMGREGFPDQLMLAFHQFQDSDNVPWTGSELISSLFRQQFSVGTPFPAEAMLERTLMRPQASATPPAAAATPEAANFSGKGYTLGGGEEKKHKDSDKKLEVDTNAFTSDKGYDSAADKSTDKKQRIKKEIRFEVSPGHAITENNFNDLDDPYPSEKQRVVSSDEGDQQVAVPTTVSPPVAATSSSGATKPTHSSDSLKEEQLQKIREARLKKLTKDTSSEEEPMQPIDIRVETIKTGGKSGPETLEPVTDTAIAATVTATVQPAAKPEAKLASQSSTSSLEEEEEDIEVMLKSGQEKEDTEAMLKLGQAKYLSTERTEISVRPPTTTARTSDERVHRAIKTSTPSAVQKSSLSPSVSPISKKRASAVPTKTGVLSVVPSSRLPKGGSKTLSPTASTHSLTDKRRLPSSLAPSFKTKATTTGAEPKLRGTLASSKTTSAGGAAINKQAKTKQDHQGVTSKVSPPVRGKKLTPPTVVKAPKSKATPETQRRKELISKRSTSTSASQPLSRKPDEFLKESTPGATPFSQKFDIVQHGPITPFGSVALIPLPVLKISLPGTIIDSPDKLFKDLAQNLNNWKMLGRYLEVDDQQLAMIARVSSDTAERARLMLKGWLSQSKSLGTYTKLGEALVNCMRDDLVIILEQHSNLPIAGGTGERVTIEELGSSTQDIKEHHSTDADDDEGSDDSSIKMTVPISTLLMMLGPLIEEKKKEGKASKVTVSLKFH